MRKSQRKTLTAALALALASTASLALTDVDEIVRRHIEARGGYAAIKAIRSIVYSEGLYREGDYESSGDAFMALMRPGWKLVGDPESPGGYLEGYDGAAWEWYDDPGVVLRTAGAAAGAIRRYADVEGPFVDYRAKGSTVAFEGSDEIDGRPAYRLELTMRDGYATDFFIDSKSYLVVASRASAPIHAFGPPVTAESRFSDYRRVGGVLFSYRSTSTEIATGRELDSMQWGKIEVNRELPSTWFSPPEFSRTRLQTLIEHIFGERTDIDAVLWTYADFRRAHPELDTHGAIEVAGYQMLKMGEIDQAVRLLQVNARDYPESASSAFGLGRAYATKGDKAAARAELKRALELDPDYERAATLLKTLD